MHAKRMWQGETSVFGVSANRRREVQLGVGWISDHHPPDPTAVLSTGEGEPASFCKHARGLSVGSKWWLAVFAVRPAGFPKNKLVHHLGKRGWFFGSFGL